MRLTLTCAYETRFLPVIWSFVTETARALGASEVEAQELGLASEEAAAHIIESFPGGSGVEERFEVHCEAREDGLEYVFNNLGPPINVAALPRYEKERPEDTIEGLRFMLLERFVDSFELVNRGHEGWRTVIFKRIGRPRLGRPAEAAGAGEELGHAAEKLSVRRATPEDAAAIVDLAYHNYHYTYAKELFYFAERLAEELRAEHVVSFVASSPAGALVGQLALLASAAAPEVAEVGALMVRPEYRRSLGLLHLVKAAYQYGTSERSPFALYYSNLVTAHTMSQKASGLFRFRPMAIEVSVHERAAFLGLEGVTGQRESLLHAVTWPRPPAELQLCVPARHGEISRKLLARFGIGVTCLESERASPEPAGATALEVRLNRETALATVAVRHGGPDLAARLRRCLYEVEGEDVKTVHVRVPAWLPAAGDLESHAASLGLFFCGLVVEAPERWHLLYAKICRQRFDFAQVQLADPAALELRDYVEACYRRTVPE